jgi:hypothetical protein
MDNIERDFAHKERSQLILWFVAISIDELYILVIKIWNIHNGFVEKIRQQIVKSTVLYIGLAPTYWHVVIDHLHFSPNLFGLENIY